MEPEKQITPILVINNASYKPYIEAFQYEPENIIQQPLGTLVGFFEVRDYNEDSAYIVNFLTSVLKKEYYINSKRAVTESLDAALHKVNLALSELAKNGNVNWMGNLDAAICVLEKNSIHFSVAGDAKILLSRKETFTGISDGLASEESKLHPLKTFIQVASGRIEINDRIILCSHGVFSILNQDELRKNSNRLSEEKFIQFLKTALSNELDAAYAACILIKKTQPQSERKPKKSERETSVKNAFSQQAFARPPKEETELIIPLLEDSKTETEDNDGYTDKKTGHIYVQGQELPQDYNTGKWQTRLTALKEGAFDSIQHAYSKLRRKIFLLKKDFVSILEARAAKRAAEKVKQASLIQEEIPTAAEEISQQETSPTSTSPVSIKKQTAPPKKDFRKPVLDDFTKQKSAVQFPPRETSEQDIQEIIIHESPTKDSVIKKIFSTLESLLGKAKNLLKKSKHTDKDFPSGPRPRMIAPSLARMRGVFTLLSRRQKTSAIIVILLIIIIPLLFIKLSNRQKIQKQETATTEQPSGKQLLAGETNISLDAEVKDIVSNAQTVSIISTRDESFAITEKSLISFEKSEPKEHPFPQDFAKPKASAYMDDLDLIFLLSEKDRLISFSPGNKQFKENNLSIPSGAKPRWITTYLTYLYLFDTEKNKIYRYPRVEGGFGEPIEWLKEELLLSDSTSVAIDENIYVASKENVLKLFKGKREPFSLQDTITTAQFDRIFTTLDSKYIYILDKKYSRLIKYDKSGTLIKQYYNESFAEGTDISANSQDSSVFVSTSKGIIELKVD
jgi:hypothetical protein